jgi:hyperosmotically inducible protein
MKNSLRTLQISVLAFATLGSPFLLAQQPDNSVQNKNAGKTADNQPNGKSDLDITAGVRKAIIADKSLSTYAHNIKIITMNGTVTLKGPVKSDSEKQQVLSDAAGVVSQSKVVDRVTVKQ